MPDLEADPTEDLDDGCRATTPPGDNLLLDFVRAEADAFEAMTHASGGRVLDDESLGVHAVDGEIASAFGNVATILRPAVRTEAVAQRLHDFYGEGPGGPFLVFSAWPTPPPTELAMAPVGHPPLMVRLPSPVPSTPRPEGVEILRVTGAEDLARFEETLFDAYPDPEMVGAAPGALFAPPVLASHWRFYLALERGRPVATAASWRSEQVATVEMVSCRPAARGRGIGAAVTAMAATDGTDLPACLISSDLGQRVYRGLGFVPFLRYTLWLGHRGVGR
jgi:hypothetical protein